MLEEALESKLQRLESRLNTLEEADAIQKFHINYISLYNHQKYAEMPLCFAQDATIDTGIFKPRRGLEEIKDLCANDLPTVNNWATAHVVVQPTITVDGDTAKGSWTMYLFFFDIPSVKGPAVRAYQALQDCEYVKVDGEWKFSSVKFICPWPRELECRPKTS